MNRPLLTVLAASALHISCSPSSPDPKAARTEPLATASGSPSARNEIVGVAGYQHTLAHSRFPVGTGAIVKDEFNMHKVVGSEGVFATRASGMATALANSDSAARRGTPIGDNAAHNDAVRAYFVSAGLPADQIDAIQDFEVVSVPATSSDVASVQRTVQFRRSMITRRVQGIPVPDSYAWARINSDGTVVEEQVYWPAIPSDTLGKALALAANLSDTSTSAALEARLPPHRKGKGLVIRHSPGEWDKEFFADAVYDVVQQGPMPAVLHANEAGVLTTLPFEAPGAWGSEVGTPRTR